MRDVGYYLKRYEKMKEGGNHFITDAKRIVTEIATASGDFDDPKYNKKRTKDAHYSRIINSIASYSSMVSSSLLVSYLTNPSERWFYLSLSDNDMKATREEAIFMRECENIMYKKLHGSKLHQALHNVYYEAENFGNGVLMRKRVGTKITYIPLTVGQYYFEEDDLGNITRFVRRFSMDVESMIERFGEDNLPKCAMDAIRIQKDRSKEFVILHFVEPNLKFLPEWDNPFNKPFISTFIAEESRKEEAVLEQKGIKRFPYFILRWDRFGTSQYGTGIGRSVLGDVRMLQSYEHDLAKASKKKLSPPLKATPDLKKVEKNSGSNGITYTNDPNGISALYNVNYETRDGYENIRRIEERITKAYYLDVFFAMMTKDKTMSATEAAAVDQERLVMLGAVTDRARSEFLDLLVEDCFGELLDANVFPTPPRSLAGREMKVEYKSMLLQSMEMTDLVTLERYLQFTAQQSALDPMASLFPKTAEINMYFAKKLGINQSNINSIGDVNRMWEQRMEAERQAQAGVNSKAVLDQAKAVRELSEANTTGENALTDLLG